MSEDFGSDFITIVDDDGTEFELELLDTMVDEDSELISIYYGENVAEEDAQELTDEITEKYPDCDVELYSGNQPVYYYLLSVE